MRKIYEISQEEAAEIKEYRKNVKDKYTDRRMYAVQLTAIPLEIKTSSLIKIFHSCVVVLDGRQPACVLRLAVKNFYSAPFISISSGIAVEGKD